MTTATLNMGGNIEAQNDGLKGSLRGMAKVTGALYLILFVVGMFSPLVLETLVVEGSAIETAESFLGSMGIFGFSLVTWFVIVAVDVAVSITLYLLFENAGRAVSLITAGFRLVYSAVLAAFLLDLYDAYTVLNTSEALVGGDLTQAYTVFAAGIADFQAGFQLALMFFGAHLVMLGVSILRSGNLPRVLGIILGISGAGYVIDSMIIFITSNHNDTLSIALLMPAVIGELGLTLWLLLKGVRENAGSEVAAA
ncbi:MAG: DUF4386 domain-containing protein [Chloroflexi bacterium]|jgi:hypothetical protein|nr:DUF4386 domain-containing protein [Chloroflexota bacterium]